MGTKVTTSLEAAMTASRTASLFLRNCMGNSLSVGLVAMVNPCCRKKVMRRTPDSTKRAIEGPLFQVNSVPPKLMASTSGSRAPVISKVPRKSKDASFVLNGVGAVCAFEGRRNNQTGAKSAPKHKLM